MNIKTIKLNPTLKQAADLAHKCKHEPFMIEKPCTFTGTMIHPNSYIGWIEVNEQYQIHETSFPMAVFQEGSNFFISFVPNPNDLPMIDPGTLKDFEQDSYSLVRHAKKYDPTKKKS